MNNHSPTCSDDQLRQFLASAEVNAAVEEHVESCLRCQARLSELAAEPTDWDETRRLLRPDDACDAFAAEARERSWSSSIRGDTESREARPAWTESMAKQLLSPPSHPEMLGRLGRYEVERLIGSGGMGIVFKAFDTELNRPVAIKVLAPHLAGNGAARQRFSREARAAAAVVHEHVVAIHNVEPNGAAPFLVMQFVAGESLQARLDRQGPLALKEILRIAHQTAAGLAAAHAQGLVHRDVKPSNIMLEQGIERALLTDFGLARAADDASLTHTGYLPGTPHYMSPEQACGDAVDARSDLFSLGSVLYAMCTGRPPFRADTTFGVLRRITDTDPRPVRETNPDIPAWLENFVGRLLAKEPAERPATAAEAADVLKQCLAHVQQPATTPLPEMCRARPRLRSARATEHGQRQFTRLSLTVIGVLLTLFLAAASTAIFFSAGRRSADTVPTATGGPPAAESPADLDWDAAASEIKALTADVDALEQRTDQLCGQQPLPSPETPSSEPMR